VPARCVLLCIGNELRGDDAAGIVLARLVGGRLAWTVIEAATAPESFLGKIAPAAPRALILVDAIDFGAQPGEIGVFAADRLSGGGPSTHAPDPAAFLAALQMTCPCPVAVVGIQPAGATLGADLTPPVRRAVESLAEALLCLAPRPQPHLHS